MSQKPRRPTASPNLLDAATDALAFLRGEIAGPSQKDGIIRELEAAILKAEMKQ